MRLKRTWTALAVCLLGLAVLSGCAQEPKRKEMIPLKPCPVKNLALAPFLAGQPAEVPNGVVCPISAEIFVGQPAGEEALEAMVQVFPAAVEAVLACPLILPSRVAGQMPPAMPSEMGLPVRQALAEAGRKVGAEAVLAGALYRFEERQGSSLAITRAASVSIGLFLLDSKSGDILWQGFFDETQKSLSENLLMATSFFNRGARWLTAAELGHYGIEEMLRRMPTQLE